MKKLTALCLVLAAVLLAACAAAEPFRTESGVTFGMTGQEILDIEAGYGREPEETTESTYYLLLPYFNDIRFDNVECEALYYSLDVTDHRLFQLFYVSRGGADDYSRIRDLLTARYGDPVDDPENEGRYSIAFEQGGRFKGEECTHWIVSGDNSLGIDLWLSKYGDVYTVFYDPSNPASSGQVVKTYSDESGISFPHMQGWEEWPVRVYNMKLCLCPFGDTRTFMYYSRTELSSLPSYQEYTREYTGKTELDYLDQVLLPRYREDHEIRNLRTEIHNGTEYRVFEYLPAEADGTPARTTYFVAVTVRNGFHHEFRLGTDKELGALLPDFEALLDSVTFEK